MTYFLTSIHFFMLFVWLRLCWSPLSARAAKSNTTVFWAAKRITLSQIRMSCGSLDTASASLRYPLPPSFFSILQMKIVAELSQTSLLRLLSTCTVLVFGNQIRFDQIPEILLVFFSGPSSFLISFARHVQS